MSRGGVDLGLDGNPVEGDAAEGAGEVDASQDLTGLEPGAVITGDVSQVEQVVPSPAAAKPRAIEELRTAGLAEMTDEEIRLVYADAGDPTAESDNLHGRIVATQDALTEQIKETNREIGVLRDEITAKFPIWQARLAFKHRCQLELSRRGAAVAVAVVANPEHDKLREKGIQSGSIAG